MILSVDEAKEYLRVDFPDEDEMIARIIDSSEKLCMDIYRTDDAAEFAAEPAGKVAVLYAVAYMYEHREDADYHALTLSLRALLGGGRKAGF